MATKIDVDVGHCNYVDIDVDVFHFGAGIPQTTERQRLTDYVEVPVTAATYTKSVDFDSMDGPIKYIVFLYTEEDNYLGGITMSYTDGVTTITPTETVDAEESWFNTADGRTVMGYYIGDDIPRSGTIRIVRAATGKFTGTFRVWVGNGFGNITKVFMEAYTSISAWPRDAGVGTTPRSITLSPAHWAWGFGGCGGVAYDGVSQEGNPVQTMGLAIIYQQGPNLLSYEYHFAPGTFVGDDTGTIDGPVYSGTFRWGMYGKGSGAQILLQDDANVGNALELEPLDTVEFIVEVGNCADVKIEVERGSC